MPGRGRHFDTLTIPEAACDSPAAQRLATSIAAEIERIMGERRAHNLRSYPLSQIGNALGPQLRELEHLTGRRLADIVRHDLGYEIAVCADRPNAPFIRTERLAAPPVRRRRVPDGLWQAFTTALPTSMTRSFAVSVGMHRDREGPSKPSTDCVPIPRDLILPAPPRHLFDAVAQTIQSWTQAHQIGWPEVVARPPSQGPAVPLVWVARPRAPAPPFRRPPREFAASPVAEGPSRLHPA